MAQVGGQSFDRGYLLALHARQRRYAGTRRFAINVHGASAAERHAAAVLGAGQPEVVAHDPKERSGRVGIYFHRLAIHGEADHESLLGSFVNSYAALHGAITSPQQYTPW